MQFTTILLASALATLSLGSPHRARQTGSIKVGQGSDQGINQDLSFVIVDFNTLSGSSGTAGSGITSAFISSDDVLSSSGLVFQDAICDFHETRIENDANGNIQCDPETRFITVSNAESELNGAVDFKGQVATCYFCRVARTGESL